MNPFLSFSLAISYQLVARFLLIGCCRRTLKERRRDAKLLRRARQSAQKTLTQLRGAHFRWWFQGQERLPRG